MQNKTCSRGETQHSIVWFYPASFAFANWSLLIARCAFWIRKRNSLGRLLIVNANICHHESELILPTLNFWPSSVYSSKSPCALCSGDQYVFGKCSTKFGFSVLAIKCVMSVTSSFQTQDFVESTGGEYHILKPVLVFTSHGQSVGIFWRILGSHFSRWWKPGNKGNF